MYIYQAANEIVSYNYTEWEIVLRANPTTIPASGGTSQLTMVLHEIEYLFIHQVLLEVVLLYLQFLH